MFLDGDPNPLRGSQMLLGRSPLDLIDGSLR
jgi:hypothetical protein